MFSKTKMRLINKNKIATYLRYAIGEIILIVLGVLIAVSLNNLNKTQQQEDQLNGIYQVLINDIVSDTIEARQIIDFYEKKKPTFERIMNDTLSVDEIDSCFYCIHLITSRRLFALNTRGYNQLIEFKNLVQITQDTTMFKIIDFYGRMEEGIKVQNNFIDQDIVENLKAWREKYPWFSNFIQDKMSKEEKAYFGRNQEYRNKVAYHYSLVFDNYLNALRNLQTQSTLIINKINERMAKNS